MLRIFVFSSSGFPQPPTDDPLNSYLRQVLAMVGYTNYSQVVTDRTITRDREEMVDWTREEATVVAQQVDILLNSYTRVSQTQSQYPTFDGFFLK